MAEFGTYEHLRVAHSGPVATATLNRPEVHNALSPATVQEIGDVFRRLADNAEVRVVVLTGAGRSFCAGADINSMRAAADYSEEENHADALSVVRMLETIDTCPKPVIARVNGPAFGGGVGLVAACDVAIAAETARFCFSEVRLGIVPAMISPYVVRRVGPGAARTHFLLGEPFDAAEARRIGLVFQTCSQEALDAEVDKLAGSLLSGSPTAQSAIKDFVRDLATGAVQQDRIAEYTAGIIAERRASPEGREGMRAFLERRPPAWAPKSGDQE